MGALTTQHPSRCRIIGTDLERYPHDDMARKKSSGAERAVKGPHPSKTQEELCAHKLGAELQMFKSLSDHSTEFIGMCDLQLRPFYVNAAGLKLVGLDSVEEAAQLRVQDFFFPEDQRLITEEFFPKVLREGKAEMEGRFRHFKTNAASSEAEATGWQMTHRAYVRSPPDVAAGFSLP